MEDLTGKQFGTYRIVGPLGEGGMAAVYKAYQPGMERYVAVKVLPRQLAVEAEFAGRFAQEARLLARLQHPHILPIFDYGTEEGYTYIVMPFIESGALAEQLQGQPLSLSEISRIVAQIGSALDYAHAQGLIHRDIKPSNILVDKQGNCILTDFGIAKLYEGTAQFTNTGGIIGTPTYMSPEQGSGREVTSRSDIYSLGVVLYQMVTGRVPFRAETPMAVIFKHIHDPLPPPRSLNPTVPEPVEGVILKSLAKEPADRYTTAGELVQALQSAIAQSGQAATKFASLAPSPPVPQPRHPSSRRLYLAVMSLLLLFCLTALVLGRGRLTSLFREQAVGNLSRPAGTATPTLAFTTPAAVAVQPTPEPTTPAAPTSTLTPLPTPTNTLEPTAEINTPTQLPEPAATAEPTAISILPTAMPSCPSVSGVFATVWSTVQAQIGCATGAAIVGTVVEENFQMGKMFWREPLDFAQALVVFSNGSWQIFQHPPYNEGDPEYPCTDANTPAQSPPTPRRGFGTMWCNIPAIRNGLGNATDAERAYSGAMQEFSGGFMLRTDEGTTYVFYISGIWERR